MRTSVAVFFACVLATASVACAADPEPAGEPSAAESAHAPSVTKEGDTVRVQFGADEIAVGEVDGRRSVAYFQSEKWVGTIAYRASDRSLKISAPGFEREQILAFDLDARISDAQGTESLMTILGITEAEQLRYLGGLVATDAHLAANADLLRSAATHESASGAIQPQMWNMCYSRGKSLACAVVTAGLCGYALAINCLLMG